MARSFGIVEEKLRESDFFLELLRKSSRMDPAARYYFSAFISSSRSVTFALQASLSGISGFSEWYSKAQHELRTDQLSAFFLEIRNQVVHVGDNPLNRVTIEHLRQDLSQQLHGRIRSHTLIIPDAERLGATILVDAVESGTAYFTSLVRVIYECYSNFKTVVDSRWYFTSDNFANQGKTFRDALVENGFPPPWADGISIGADAWRTLRARQPPCLINDLFHKYLKRTIPDPDRGDPAEINEE